jgi:hypothetical protein
MIKYGTLQPFFDYTVVLPHSDEEPSSVPCKACAASDASTTGMQIHIRLLASAPLRGLSSSLY